MSTTPIQRVELVGIVDSFSSWWEESIISSAIKDCDAILMIVCRSV